MPPKSDFLEPPLYFLLGKGEKLNGNHHNLVWRGQVGRESDPTIATPMILKFLWEGKIALCIELACALAAQALQQSVPMPALVICDSSDLPGIPNHISGNQLLIGSHHKQVDALYTQIIQDNDAADEFIWDRVCSADVGAKGASWDELVANSDRHCENLLFDGKKWWLFDHDQALPRAREFISSKTTQEEKREALLFRAKCNQLAEQMLKRRPNNHDLTKQASEFNRYKIQLWELKSFAKNWESQIPEIQEIYEITYRLIDKIYTRLPSLELYLDQRISAPDANSLWTSLP